MVSYSPAFPWATWTLNIIKTRVWRSHIGQNLKVTCQVLMPRDMAVALLLGCNCWLSGGRCGQLVSSAPARAVPWRCERERTQQEKSQEDGYQGWTQINLHTGKGLRSKEVSSGWMDGLPKVAGVLTHFWVLWKSLKRWVCPVKNRQGWARFGAAHLCSWEMKSKPGGGGARL